MKKEEIEILVKFVELMSVLEKEGDKESVAEMMNVAFGREVTSESK